MEFDKLEASKALYEREIARIRAMERAMAETLGRCLKGANMQDGCVQDQVKMYTELFNALFERAEAEWKARDAAIRSQ